MPAEPVRRPFLESSCDRRRDPPPRAADQYAPAEVEGPLYERWVERGYFTADPDSGKPPFSIVIPPPNVTGSLHLGHALRAVDDGRADPARPDARASTCSGCRAWTTPASRCTPSSSATSPRPRARAASTTAREEFVARVVGVEGALRRPDPRPDAPPRRRRRLDRASGSRMDDGLSRAVQTIFKTPLRRRADLPRRADHQLVPARSHRALRRRGRPRGGARRAGLDPLRRRRGIDRRRHHPRRDDARRHRGGRAPRRRAVPAPRRHRGRAAADQPPHPDHRRRARRPVLRHRRGEGDAGARPERLRDRPAARPADADDHGRAGGDHRAGPVPGPRPAGGAVRDRRRAARGRPRSSPRSGPTCTRSGTARDATRSSSRALSLQWWVRVESLAKAAGDAVRDGRVAGRAGVADRRATSSGSTTCATGASAASCGGATASRSGTRPDGDEQSASARTSAAGRLDPGRGRARHLVLLGAVAVLDARLARGHRRPAHATTRPRCWSPATTSSSSGSSG